MRCCGTLTATYHQSYCGVDVELKQRIQNKLIARIMERFKPE